MNLWTRLGMSVAVLGAFAIVMTEFLQSTAFYETFKWRSCSTLLGLGGGVWLMGRLRHAQAAREAATAAEAQPAAPAEGVNLRFGGLLLMAMGAIAMCIIPTRDPAPVVQARTAVTETNAPPAPPPAVEWPALRLQGIVYRRLSPSALINGKTCFIGERIGAATLRAIDRDHVTVELGGATNVLWLRQP